MNGDGLNKLANVLDARMRERSDKDLVIDYGTIKKNGYLITDSFQVYIRSDGYHVLASVGTLSENDRVLVAWVGSNAIVVGKIL